ncbi:MAG: hypothetical protein ACOC5M_01430 [Chloroflexota bacterium]
MAGKDMPIEAMLDDLGYMNEEAQALALDVLERAGVTNARKRNKRNIAANKREQARQALSEALAACCGSPRCEAMLAHDPRPRARVQPVGCAACGGSANSGAARAMADTLAAAGLSRLLVIGGNPGTRGELERLLADTGVEVTTVDGSTPPTSGRAKKLLEASDVVVIWGSTELAHKVSKHFERPEHRDKTITVARRGIATLADEVAAHVKGRSGNGRSAPQYANGSRGPGVGKSRQG